MELYFTDGTCSLFSHILAREARTPILLDQRLAFVESHLAASGPFLMGERLSAPDASFSAIVSWSAHGKVDLAPALRRFMASVGSRPSVREASKAERAEVVA
ncbi:MAG TPA: hypothetical protein VHL31_21840 [Geminicoccus sp.]|uniref:hypothetical protein n=1 Tax=Geminicoccus sp. TaxID=2024832 RepID=UPI002E31E700|nr:hypothetical protein [Geminicoccus sp.]HEX2528922.1 hypothetical protein [Geminicoccus sp.]